MTANRDEILAKARADRAEAQMNWEEALRAAEERDVPREQMFKQLLDARKTADRELVRERKRSRSAAYYAARRAELLAKAKASRPANREKLEASKKASIERGRARLRQAMIATGLELPPHLLEPGTA